MLTKKDLETKNLAESIETTITVKRDRTSFASWLFFIGSSIFLIDGFLELTEGVSIHVLLHLSASVLFTIGSALFIPQDENS